METVLFSVSYLIEVEEELLSSSDEAEAFNNEVFKKLSGSGWKRIDAKHKAERSSSSFSVLEPQRMNCGKCYRCGIWVTDRGKPDSIRGLTNGATVDGALLCDDCLPKEHRWAF